jgi:hypothetical protein
MDEANIIIQVWGLDASGLHTKEEILAALEARIGEILARDPMSFIQLMYRLDISEAQLDAAMDQPSVGAIIAQLIWDRQVQKSILRKSTPPRSTGEDEDLHW